RLPSLVAWLVGADTHALFEPPHPTKELRQTGEGRRHPSPDPALDGRRATVLRTRWDGPVDAGLGRDLRPVTDREVARRPRLAAHHDPGAEHRAPPEADLSSEEAAGPDAAPVADHDEIVELAPAPHDRCGEGGSIDCGVRADFDVLLAPFRCEFRIFRVAVR